MLSLSSWGLLAHVIGYVPLYNPLLRVTYISKVRVHMRQNMQFLSSETGPLHLIEPFVFPPIFLQISFFLNSQTKFHYETRHIVIIQSSASRHAAGSFLLLWIMQLLHEEMRLRPLGARPAVAELDHTVSTSIPSFAGNLRTDFHRAALTNSLANRKGLLAPLKPGSICCCLFSWWWPFWLGWDGNSSGLNSPFPSCEGCWV